MLIERQDSPRYMDTEAINETDKKALKALAIKFQHCRTQLRVT